MPRLTASCSDTNVKWTVCTRLFATTVILVSVLLLSNFFAGGLFREQTRVMYTTSSPDSAQRISPPITQSHQADQSRLQSASHKGKVLHSSASVQLWRAPLTPKRLASHPSSTPVDLPAPAEMPMFVDPPTLVDASVSNLEHSHMGKVFHSASVQLRKAPLTPKRLASHPPSPPADIPTPAEMHKFVDPPTLVDANVSNLELVIVYNGLIYPKRQHWLELMSEQLDEFNCNGMAQRAKHFYVMLTIDRAGVDHEAGSNNSSSHLVKTTITALTKIIPKAVFSVTYENKFEYPGIRQLWDAASSIPKGVANDTIMVYLHSKGMVNTHMSSSFHGVRTPFEVNLFHKTFDPWTEVFAKFNKHPELNKVGCYPDWTGVMWYNVYYARASYIQRLIAPVYVRDRFFYELWLRFLDGERETSSQVHTVQFDVRVRRKIVNSFCADCWSTCAQNETLGVTYNKDTLHIVEHPKLLDFDWYKCRNNTVLPRPPGIFSTNTQEHI